MPRRYALSYHLDEGYGSIPQVTFGNPQWATFMDGVVNETCKVLRVHRDISDVQWQLSKLLLDGTGPNLKYVNLLPSVFLSSDLESCCCASVPCVTSSE